MRLHKKRPTNFSDSHTHTYREMTHSDIFDVDLLHSQPHSKVEHYHHHTGTINILSKSTHIKSSLYYVHETNSSSTNPKPKSQKAEPFKSPAVRTKGGTCMFILIDKPCKKICFHR